MVMMETLSKFAEHWMEFMLFRSLDFTLAFGLIGLVWFFINRRVSSQFGYLLFLLVILKLAIPPQFSLPNHFSSLNNTPAKIGAPVNFEGSMIDGAVDETRSGDAVVTKPESESKATLPVSISIPTLLMAIWAFGIICFGIRLFWIEWKSLFMIRNTIPLDPTCMSIDLQDLQKQTGIRRKVSWVTGDWIKTPIAYGIFHPVVAVPKRMNDHHSRQQIRFILLHELAHIQRWDSLVSFMQNITRVLFFFHPLVWWVNNIIDQQREYACDDAALRWSKASRKECGEGFLGLVMQVNELPAFAPSALGFVDYKTFIRRRLMRILDKTRTLKQLSFSSLSLLLILSAFVSLFGVQAIAQGLQWTELTSTTQPPPRVRFKMVYDSQRDRIVLHGGYREDINSNGTIERVTLSDTWEYDGNEWQLVSEDGPQILSHAMAYDPIRGETVLFGGMICIGKHSYICMRETWRWDGSNWYSTIDTSGPIERSDAVMEFDPESQSLILYGGVDGATFFDAWSWDGNTWTQLSEEGPPIITHSITYDENRKKLVSLNEVGAYFDGETEYMVAGYTNVISEWNNNQWIQIEDGSIQPRPIPPRAGSSFIYLPFIKKILCYGGGNLKMLLAPQDEVQDDDFWTWDEERWEQIELSPKPVTRMGHGGVYDSKRDRFVIFGGVTAQDGQAYYLEDMWSLSLNQQSSIDARFWQEY